MIRFPCACGRQLQARDVNAGQNAVCPMCGREQIVPDRDVIIRPAESARAAAPVLTDLQGERSARPGHSPGPELATSGKARTSLALGLCSLLCTFFTGIPAVIYGILGLREIARSQGRFRDRWLAIAGIVLGLIGTVVMVPVFYLPAYTNMEQTGARIESANNLHEMWMAMRDYHDENGHFPGAAIRDRNGKPLLSWRVALLPYLEGPNLYKQFNLNEPWDSPNNLRLLPQMPETYAFPNAPAGVPRGYTFYQVVVGPGTAFEKPRGHKLAEFTDGPSETLLVVEAANAVPWTKPEDLDYDPTLPLPAFGTHFKAGFNALFADGSIRCLPRDTPPATLRAIITRNGGEPVNFP
jgi:hypothetical protein